MKRVVLAIIIALFGITASGVVPGQDLTVYAQKKGGDKGEDKREKKDPPGPPVVRDKEPRDKGERPRPKEKKPDDR